MELGDLQQDYLMRGERTQRRNPRYNGIGWFTKNNFGVKNVPYSRNPRYNGIGWFTKWYLINGKSKAVAILAIMELGDLPKLPNHPKFSVEGRNPRYNGIGWFTLRFENEELRLLLSQSSL